MKRVDFLMQNATARSTLGVARVEWRCTLPSCGHAYVAVLQHLVRDMVRKKFLLVHGVVMLAQHPSSREPIRPQTMREFSKRAP